MTRKRYRNFAPPLLALLALAAAGCSMPREPEEVWATVNGRPILRRMVETRFEREVAQFADPLTEDEALTRKLNILTEVIQQELLMQKAAEAGVMANEQEIGAEVERLTGPRSEEDFLLQLEAQGMNLADLSDQLHREISIRKLLEQVSSGAREVTQAEMEEYYEANKADYHLVEPQFRVAIILVTPRADREVRNLGNNDARSPADAQRKVQTLMERLRAGEEFESLARQYSEDPVTSLSGGDLGFFPESALQATHPALRDAVRRLQPGSWTGPVSTPEGIFLVELLEYEAPGQRLLDEPTVRDSVLEHLRRIKRTLAEEAYIEEARNHARIENYLAHQILETSRAEP